MSLSLYDCSKPIQKHVYFSSHRSFVQVRFIQDKQQFSVLANLSCIFQPFFRIVPKDMFDWSHQHIFQHAVIRNQNVRSTPSPEFSEAQFPLFPTNFRPRPFSEVVLSSIGAIHPCAFLDG